MAATFPAAPTNGQVAEVGGRYYTYNSTLGVWENTGGAAAPIATVSAITVTGTATIATASITNNLGLGTASPTVKLDVVGSVKATQSISIGNGGGTYQAGSIYSDANWGMIFRAAQASPASAQFLWTNSADGQLMRIDTSGHLVPATTNAQDLGTASLRWRNIYTQDLHLSNGIGDYTVIEGEEDLFLVNNKTGKSFKFALIEVDPSIVPPKSTD
jgi:hypothetical protein